MTRRRRRQAGRRQDRTDLAICQDHWDRLRAAVDTRGLTSLIPDTGTRAAEQFARAASGEDTIDTFDPLMYAHWAIFGHAIELLGRPWPGGCPLCFLNAEHERTCTGCALPRVNGFDDWIDKAADAALGHWNYLAGKDPA